MWASQGAMKSGSKIVFTRIIWNSVIAASISSISYRVLVSHMNKTVEFELYMGLCFFTGFFSDTFTKLLTNKSLLKKAAQSAIGSTGKIGKAIVEAWKKNDREEEAKKEKAKKEKDAKEAKEKSKTSR